MTEQELHDIAHALGNQLDKVLLDLQPEDRIPVLAWVARGYSLEDGLAVPRGRFLDTLKLVRSDWLALLR